MIFICPLSEVEATLKAHKPSHLVSLLDLEGMIDTPEVIPPGNHLKLAMNDISAPRTGYKTPDHAHVEDLINFIITWPQTAPLLIHCWAGISRSTAAAFIALCVNNPDQDENHLADILRAASPSATPNKMIVHLADGILNRAGRMSAAIETIGRGADAWQGNVFSLPIKIGA